MSVATSIAGVVGALWDGSRNAIKLTPREALPKIVVHRKHDPAGTKMRKKAAKGTLGLTSCRGH